MRQTPTNPATSNTNNNSNDNSQQQYSDIDNNTNNDHQNGGSHNVVINSNNSRDNNTSSNNSKPVIERGASWGFGETKLLLALWSQDMVQRQLTNSKRTRHVWEKIAERIREHGYDRTADQVRTRVFNMIAEYRRIMKNPTPERRKKCIFFDALHRIYQAKDSNTLENVIMSMNYHMMDNHNTSNSNNAGSITNDSNFDSLDFNNDNNNSDQIDTNGGGIGGAGDEQNHSGGSGDDIDERNNNEMLVFPLSPNTFTMGVNNGNNANDIIDDIDDDDDDDTNFNYDEFLPQTKRFRPDSIDHPSNGHTLNNHNSLNNHFSSLDSTASALLIDRMFQHLSKETEVMREWVSLERERLAQEVARRKEEKEREERREKIFLDVLTKLQERIFSVMKDLKCNLNNNNEKNDQSSSSSSSLSTQQQQIPSSSTSTAASSTAIANTNQSDQ